MSTLITIITLCICSIASIISVYWLTHMLLGLNRLRKYTSYVVFGGYILFILINILIWLCGYDFVCMQTSKGLASHLIIL